MTRSWRASPPGAIRALWVIAGNTAHSWINSSGGPRAARASRLPRGAGPLRRHRDRRSTPTSSCPGGWLGGEKEGTFINSERRLGVLKQVRRAPGQALADFWIFKLIAEAWGCGHLFERWETPEATLWLLTQLTAGQPCDLSGVESYAQIDKDRGGSSGPHPAGAPRAPEPERRLFADGRFFTDDGRARFVFEGPVPVPEATDDRYPLALLTGRGSSNQWHTQTRTRRSNILRRLSPRPVAGRGVLRRRRRRRCRRGRDRGDRVSTGVDPGNRAADAHRPGRTRVPSHARRGHQRVDVPHINAH